MMSKLVLYKTNGSPPACAVMMLTEILGLEMEYEDIALLKLEHKTPDFKKLNPMGTLPVLKDGDFVVSESHAIMKYLLNVYGGKHRDTLYPSEPRAQALVDQCLFFDTGVAFIRLKVIALPTFFHGVTGPTAQQQQDLDDAYAVVEAYLQDRRYVAADHLTIADLSLGSTITASQVLHKLDETRYPRTADWLSRLEAEPYFENINKRGNNIFNSAIKMFWEKNKQKQ